MPENSRQSHVWMKLPKFEKKIAGSVDEYKCEEIFRSGPDDTKSNSAYCQDNDRVGNRVKRSGIRAKSFDFSGMAKNKAGSVCQAKNERH
jgi:hypothetical protein